MRGIRLRPEQYISPASFWLPEIVVRSGWHEHVPFAFWAIETLKPRRIVELGTHNGYSFFAFCQAIRDLQIDCEAIAVDTWQGDEHAGQYDESVYAQVSRIHEENFASFSTLLRMTFDEALNEVADGTVDLLHVDGRHFEEDVRHDFESWIPKLSDRAVVLFHDTQVKERGFGVYRYWATLSEKYETFEFHHGHGLGVLLFGDHVPKPFVEVIRATEDPAVAADVRLVYSRLGGSIRDKWLAQSVKRLGARDERIARLREETKTLRRRAVAAERERNQAVAKLESLEQSKWWKAGEPVRAVRRKVR